MDMMRKIQKIKHPGEIVEWVHRGERDGTRGQRQGLEDEVERLKSYYEAVDNALIVSGLRIASGDAQNDVRLLAHLAYEEGRFSAAERCTEIAQNEAYDDMSEYDLAVGHIVNAIRKEFGIEGSE